MTDKKILAYDFECFVSNWLVVIIDYESKEKTVIIDDVQKLRIFYEENKLNIWVGYNSREYDQYILKGLLLGIDPWFINTEIITNGKRGWQVVRDAEEYPLYNFDISTGFHSLKQLEGFMGSMIKESDIPFDIDRPLTEEEIKQTVYYCTHDVMETIKVFEYRREEFDSQLLMIEAFDLPMQMFTKTKAQLAATVLDAKRGINRNDEFELVFPDTLILSDKYRYIADWYKDRKNHDYNKSLVAEVAGVPHVFAWGGLHAAIPNYQAEGIIVHCDVASLYPSIMIEYGFQSRNIKDKNKYSEIRARRMKLKKEKNPMQAPMKIILNGTYGALKDQHNPLYDPLESNNVCVTGQLLILDLIEKLEQHCVLIQSNTDGLFLKVDEERQIETLKAIAKEWEIRTRLTLEWGVSKKIVQKDVNNYIVIEEDGTYESKGSYLKKLSDTDYDLAIVNKALIDYFIDGTPIRTTVESCNDLRDFQKIIKITSLYRYALHGNKRIKEKVHRVFASKDQEAPGLFKAKTEDKIEKIANTPDHCFIFNDYCKGLPCPEELDKEYYVNIAEKRLQDFLSTKKSKASKQKSEIKYVSYDCKSSLDSIEHSEYDMFSDLVVYLLDNKIANVKQILILIKLDYFRNFGNAKELTRLMEIMEIFKYGSTISFKKEKLENENIAYLSDIIQKHSCDKLKSGKTSSSYTIENMEGILHDCEKLVLSCDLKDYSYKEKVEHHFQYTDGIYPSFIEDDRKTLYVSEIRPVNRKRDGAQFGYNISTVSFGSGIKGRFTIYNKVYNKQPVSKGDVIRLIKYEPNRGYFDLTSYKVLS